MPQVGTTVRSTAGVVTTLPITAPSGVLVTDRVLIYVETVDTFATTTITVNNGMVQVGARVDVGSGTFFHLAIFDSAGADVSAVGTFTATFSNTSLGSAAIATRVYETSGIDSTASSVQVSDLVGNSALAVPQVTTTVNGELVIISLMGSASITHTTPIGFTTTTEGSDATSSFEMFTKTLAVAGVSGTPTTTDSAAEQRFMCTVAYKATVGGGPIFGGYRRRNSFPFLVRRK